jgi:gliding motility-associated lipoprotein GldH
MNKLIINKSSLPLLLIGYCLLPIASCFLLNSCTQIDIFEKNTVIPKYEWQQGFTAKGDFIISDTNSAYSIYLVLRHTDAYQYNNIWLNIGLQPPGDSMRIQKVNIILGDDANGWEGTGTNDIWEVRKLLNGAPRRFKQAGKYSFNISQIMRDNPLHHIMSAGLHIKKQKD